MQKMATSILVIDDAHICCTLKAFRQFGNDQSVGRITVTLHLEDVSEDGYCVIVIVDTRDGSFTIQGVFVW